MRVREERASQQEMLFPSLDLARRTVEILLTDVCYNEV